MRSAGIALGVVGGVAQLAIAFMGDAIGGMSAAVVLLALDALVAIVGAALAARWGMLGAGIMLAAGLGAMVALFGTTVLEIAVAVILLLAVAATVSPNVVRR